MNSTEYLKRIQYPGKVAISIDGLRQLQKQHLLNIPFENLDIHSNTKIELDIHKIFEKVVHKKRGGFCYELNGLFFNLLVELGFETRMISAKVFDAEKGYGKEHDHLALIVSLDKEEYLVDVGFGEFLFHPLLVELDTIQSDERGLFLIDKLDDEYYRVNKLVEEKRIPQYIFKSIPRSYSEFNEMCNFHQVSPESHFTKKRFIGIPIPNGRITLAGTKLKIIRGSEIEEREVDEEEYKAILVKYFKFDPK